MASRDDVVLLDCGLAKWYEGDWQVHPASITALFAVCGDERFSEFVLPACGYIAPGATWATGLVLHRGRLLLHSQPVPAVPEAEALLQFLGFLEMLSDLADRRLTLVAHNEPSIDSLYWAINRCGLLKKYGRHVASMRTSASDIRECLKLGPLVWGELEEGEEEVVNQGSLKELGRAFDKHQRSGEFATAYRLRVLKHVVHKLGIDSFEFGQNIKLSRRQS